MAAKQPARQRSAPLSRLEPALSCQRRTRRAYGGCKPLQRHSGHQAKKVSPSPQFTQRPLTAARKRDGHAWLSLAESRRGQQKHATRAAHSSSARRGASLLQARELFSGALCAPSAAGLGTAHAGGDCTGYRAATAARRRAGTGRPVLARCGALRRSKRASARVATWAGARPTSAPNRTRQSCALAPKLTPVRLLHGLPPVVRACMEAFLVVLFAPAALIAASALGLHQFFALWRVFATAVNTRSGSQAWKTVQPGAFQSPRSLACTSQAR